jgi:hypothetical protein
MEFGILCAFALVSGLALDARAACGDLVVSKGDVKIASGKTKAVSPAPEGTKICSGDTIIAGPQSRAKIKMEDGNELNISPDSKIVLEQYEFKPEENKKKVLLNILSGKVRAATAKEGMYNDKSTDGQANTFQVRTKSAVAGVRGTDFLTGYNPSNNKSEVVTFRGKVEFGQPGPGGRILNPVQVIAGQKTEVLAGQPPAPPRPVPPAELDKMNTDTKADTSTSKNNSPGAANEDKKDKKDDKQPGDKQPAASNEGGKQEGDKQGGEKQPSASNDGGKTGSDPKQGNASENAQPNDPKQTSSSDGKQPASSNGGGSQASTGSGSGSATAAAGGAAASTTSAAAGAAGSATAAAPASMIGSEGTRAPSSVSPISTFTPTTGTGSMLTGADLAKSPTTGTVLIPTITNIPSVPIIPVAPTVVAVPVCTICNQVIQTGPSKVNIKINFQQ